MRPRLVVVLAVAALPAAAAAPALGATAPLLREPRPVHALAADGPNAAAFFGCHRVALRAASGGPTAVAARVPDACNGGVRAALRAFVLGGTRAALIEESGGNDTESELATVEPRRPGSLRHVADGEIVEESFGTALTGVVAAGAVTAYSRVTRACDAQPPDDPCSHVSAVTDIDRVAVTGRRRILRVDGDATVAAAGGGRVAYRLGNLVVVVDAATGSIDAQVPAAGAVGVDLTADALVLLFRARLDVMPLGVGAPTTVALPARARRDFAVEGRVAVYRSGRFVHALRLVDGRDAVVARAPRAVRAVAIGGAGIVWAVNTGCARAATCVGTVRLVTNRAIAAALAIYARRS